MWRFIGSASVSCPILLMILSSASASASILGYIDGVTVKEDGTALVKGWACDSGINRSVEVRVYAGGNAGDPGVQRIGSGTADGPNEGGVNAACGTSGSRHRFSVRLMSEQLKAHAGKPIFVQGMSVSGGTNASLANGGKYKVPAAATSTSVIGRIDSVTHREDGTAVVKGWACDRGVNRSIEVRVYAGSNAEGPGLRRIGSGIAEGGPNGSAVDAACRTSGSKHRFTVWIRGDQLKTHAGKLIFVQGISASGGPDALLSSDGTHSIDYSPPHPETAKIIGSINNIVAKEDGTAIVKGWACHVGVNESIQVNVYVGGIAGGPPTGSRIGAVMASEPSEEALNVICGSLGMPAPPDAPRGQKGLMHRFTIRLTSDQVRAHAGKPIFVQGMSMYPWFFVPNTAWLANGGNYTVPSASANAGVIGSIDRVIANEDGTAIVQGWACDRGINRSIQVRVHVGGNAGDPGAERLSSARAEGSNQGAENAACGTSVSMHRFAVRLTSDQVKAHAGKPIYVQGLSVSGRPNASLSKGGKYKVPSIGR
jgi:hypothetical protein